jgi:hypothetical protein
MCFVDFIKDCSFFLTETRNFFVCAEVLNKKKIFPTKERKNNNTHSRERKIYRRRKMVCIEKNFDFSSHNIQFNRILTDGFSQRLTYRSKGVRFAREEIAKSIPYTK